MRKLSNKSCSLKAENDPPIVILHISHRQKKKVRLNEFHEWGAYQDYFKLCNHWLTLTSGSISLLGEKTTDTHIPNQIPSQASEQLLRRTMKGIISPANSTFSLQMHLQVVSEGNNIMATGLWGEFTTALTKNVNYYSSLASESKSIQKKTIWLQAPKQTINCHRKTLKFRRY